MIYRNNTSETDVAPWCMLKVDGVKQVWKMLTAKSLSTLSCCCTVGGDSWQLSRQFNRHNRRLFPKTAKTAKNSLKQQNCIKQLELQSKKHFRSVQQIDGCLSKFVWSEDPGHCEWEQVETKQVGVHYRTFVLLEIKFENVKNCVKNLSFPPSHPRLVKQQQSQIF